MLTYNWVMLTRRSQRPSLQDVLAGVTFLGIAAGLARSVVTAPRYGVSTTPGWLVVMVVLIPAAIGAAYGCMADGWRGCWRLSLLGVATGVAFFVVWALMKGSQ
jgi:hypothetical protein